MKLIFCPACDDVVRIIDHRRACRCRQSWGRYLDTRQAVYGGKAVPIGIPNGPFAAAYRERGHETQSTFGAFFFPANAPTFRPEQAKRQR